MLVVPLMGVELLFASVAELEHVIAVLAQKNLPSTIALCRMRGTQYGPSNHWLSRLPAHLKSWRKRERALPILQQALAEFKRVQQVS